MKIQVRMDKKEDCVQITLIVIDTEESFSNKLFKHTLDYPSSKYYDYVENDVDSINYIENIFNTEEEAKAWAEREVKALKNNLGI